MLQMRDINIRPDACIVLAVSVLVIPGKLLVAWVLAAIIHEISHCIAIKAMRVEITYVQIGAFGAQIHTGPLDGFQELICAIAGPVGSLLITVFYRHFPTLALCGLLQAAFNLLPIYPLDGGRALFSGLRYFAGDMVAAAVRYWSTVFIILAFLLLAAYFKIKLGCIFLVLMLAIKFFSTKFPCKQTKQIVQ